MKSLLKNILIFIIPLLLLVVGSSVLAKMVLKRGDFFRLKPDTEYLILGHSQPECGINDSLISHAQNFSQGGESYFYTYLKLQKLLEANPKVKTVFISYANNQVNTRMDKWIWGNENMYANYPKYSFMMDSHDYRVLLAHNPQEVLKSETKLVKDFLGFMVKNRTDYLRDRNWGGYLYINRSKVDSLLKTDYLEKERKAIKLKFSRKNIEYLQKIVALCKQKNVRIIFLRMPVRPDLPFLKNEKQFLAVKRILFNDIEFIDFKNFPAAHDEVGDFDHLNHVGARRFSLFFNGLLESGLLKSRNMQGDINAAMLKLTQNDSIR
ncbi:MAG: hypothetical protein EOO48_07505 [Flavobacterium sp.]|nr:MAG: hypothetical protein EOO48_07505 [Flavobacterium sp.]